MKISVIPTYCENETIGRLIDHLQLSGAENIAEISVVDGHSDDRTVEKAKQHNVMKERFGKLFFMAVIKIYQSVYLVTKKLSF